MVRQRVSSRSPRSPMLAFSAVALLFSSTLLSATSLASAAPIYVPGYGETSQHVSGDCDGTITHLRFGLDLAPPTSGSTAGSFVVTTELLCGTNRAPCAENSAICTGVTDAAGEFTVADCLAGVSPKIVRTVTGARVSVASRNVEAIPYNLDVTSGCEFNDNEQNCLCSDLACNTQSDRLSAVVPANGQSAPVPVNHCDLSLYNGVLTDFEIAVAGAAALGQQITAQLVNRDNATQVIHDFSGEMNTDGCIDIAGGQIAIPAGVTKLGLVLHNPSNAEVTAFYRAGLKCTFKSLENISMCFNPSVETCDATYVEGSPNTSICQLKISAADPDRCYSVVGQAATGPIFYKLAVLEGTEIAGTLHHADTFAFKTSQGCGQAGELPYDDANTVTTTVVYDLTTCNPFTPHSGMPAVIKFNSLGHAFSPAAALLSALATYNLLF